MPDRFPAHLPIQEFQYELPEEKIARFPLPQRDDSKLLIWRQGKITESHYARIAGELPAHSTLLFNDSKVIAARLIFKKPTGGLVEIFCLEPAGAHSAIHEAMLTREKSRWTCLIGGASKWKRGTVLEKKTNGIYLQARLVERQPDHFVVEFSWQPASRSFADLLHELGSIPLPPYLKRSADSSDKERYQTIYAREEGSVAAPTAGLHFTETIFQSLENKNIGRLYMTLHVGAGTFMPVKSALIGGHEMHEEFIDLKATAVEQLLEKADHPVLAVGTTSLRIAESLYWLGLKIADNKDIGADQLRVDQRDPYRVASDKPAREALELLLKWLRRQPDQRAILKTQLFIVPGYRFNLIRGLITNFHQPQSTLLLLVAALIGDDWKRVYRFALENDYRFLSYGDGCLFLPDERNFNRK